MSSATTRTPTAPWPDPPSTGATLADRLLWYPTVARWAPSKHNTQPWRFVVRDDSLEVWTDPTRALPASDPLMRELVLSCGTAVHHVEVAAAALGRKVAVTLLPEGGTSLVARVVETGPTEVTAHAHALLDAVPLRRTDRGPLDRTLLAPSLPFQLQSAAAGYGAAFRLVASAGDRATLGDLVERGDRILARQGRVEHELSR
jgi:hypothetical protein